MSLVFDGATLQSPCIFDADKLFEPPPPLPDLTLVPDSSLMSPADVTHNDEIQTAQVAALSKSIHPAPIPGACLVNPPGFVCGPLPAVPGNIVKCVPRMEHSDLNQLSARVLPLTVSTVNKELENPATPDPRFELFPDSFPPALSRCCKGGVLSTPVDIKPLPCDASAGMKLRLMPNPKQHLVEPMKLGFRSDPFLNAKLAILKNQHDSLKDRNIPLIRERDKVWNSEAIGAGLRISGSEAIWLLPIFRGLAHISDFL